MKRNRGFTLAELLIVVAILVVIATLVIGSIAFCVWKFAVKPNLNQTQTSTSLINT